MNENELTPEQVERLADAIYGYPSDELDREEVRGLVAPVVAAMLAEARADERRRIVASVRGLTRWTTDPDAKTALTELADSIARGEA